MEKLTLALPTMYGDHHVLEVRRILLEMPGVEQVYASSCFQIVELTYDPARLTADEIQAKLDESGYLQELPVPAETGAPVSGRSESGAFLRHTTAYKQTHEVVSFAQEVTSGGRSWMCPGLGVLKERDADG